MNTYEYQKLRGLERKMYFVDLLGGKCQKCGYDKNLASLDFHHIKDKNFRLDVRTLSNRGMRVLAEEVKKCMLLCANCHREEHNPTLEISEIEKILKESVKHTSLTNRVKTYKKCRICGETLAYGTRAEHCKKCSYIKKRKYKRPSKEQLISDFIELKSLNKIGKKYGVSHSSIKKLSVLYNIDRAYIGSGS
jgi:predicted Zn-ribbon and HTH transcriptional regulator